MKVVLKTMSQLLSRQVKPFGTGKYACRNSVLLPLYTRCIDVGRQLEDAHVRWEIRHIYSEYNDKAKAVSRQALPWGNQDWSQAPHVL